jgi:hypothetical protein
MTHGTPGFSENEKFLYLKDMPAAPAAQAFFRAIAGVGPGRDGAAAGGAQSG